MISSNQSPNMGIFLETVMRASKDKRKTQAAQKIAEGFLDHIRQDDLASNVTKDVVFLAIFLLIESILDAIRYKVTGKINQ